MTEVKLDAIDRKILMALQGDLDYSPTPYTGIAEQIEAPEELVLERIARLKEAGVIRRIGAMIRHIEAGIEYNGMVIWNVDSERVEEVGKALAGFAEVTHCYERPSLQGRGSSIFTMVHASSEEGCVETVKRMAQTTGIGDYEIIFSERELKKVSMTYFADEENLRD